ncbi:O-acetylhomoserine aminocarboxypropyltransferase/cysteine synthase family protein [Paenibacillus sp. S150]|uniref:O-acetylhomoserine aminocarboxypropyltransferase/cysteine synthase family protein n=1 Tax=Paenibacillus sp. S150 TaxID=2749826 RepID=UPI001C577391|nr:O-acetylhomoserine aminocarboxypropyltransferase/cysteine synthase family protein [Paenibacillus sp. S150]MBW4080353.1 O-acetylhomoserine aminocarboxypropyltransferase/cysteine synthase [Paenibacillus sp. S150]
MTDKKLGFDTLKVRAGYDSREHNYAVAVPIYQTASYDLGSVERGEKLFGMEEAGYLYTRIGNPTVAVLEQRLAALDKGTGAVAVASGMAAVTYALLNLAEGGGRILTTPRLYGGTFDALQHLYPKFGVHVDFVENSDDPEAFRRSIGPDTKAILIESISNPNSTVLDIEAIAEAAHDNGIPLVIDNTFGTPYLFDSFANGADIVIYSATKAIGGHGTTLGGVILENGKFDWANGKFPHFEEPQYLLREAENGRERSILEVFPEAPFTARVRLSYLAYFGASLGPFDAFLLLQGTETLSERISKQVANALRIVDYLQQHDRVSWVSHPAAEGSPYKALADKYFPKGAGSIFTFGFKGSEEQSRTFLNAVELFSYHANVGDARSLIINSPKTTHGELNPEEQAAAGITPETIRLSIGLEDAEDLIQDLEQAFAKAFVETLV